MNIAMEQTEEYVNGQLKAKYGDTFIRGNNGRPFSAMLVHMHIALSLHSMNRKKSQRLCPPAPCTHAIWKGNRADGKCCCRSALHINAEEALMIGARTINAMVLAVSRT